MPQVDPFLDSPSGTCRVVFINVPKESVEVMLESGVIIQVPVNPQEQGSDKVGGCGSCSVKAGGGGCGSCGVKAGGGGCGSCGAKKKGGGGCGKRNGGCASVGCGAFCGKQKTSPQTYNSGV